MTDLERAKNNLVGHTIALCKGNTVLTSDKRGISPMMDFIADGTNLSGYSVADLIVGRAAAMLFVKAGIINVYAKTMSKGGKAVLEQYGIAYGYGELTDAIINRLGTDICPMEKAVANAQTPDEAYICIKQQLELLKA